MSESESFEQWLPAIRSAVEARLDAAVSKRRLGDDCPDRLRGAMRHSLAAGGKRLRPILAMLACEACGGSQLDALPAAAAIEMVHTYSLIHDDLPAMDDDDLRRGLPTCHVEFDEATAILAGDALLTLAFETLATDLPPATAAACCADLASAAGSQGMVGGQMADLAAEGRFDLEFDAPPVPEPSPEHACEHLESIHCRKTGRLLTCALTMGARVAGAATEQIAQLEHYGKCVGLAFQIADDLLDVHGDAQTMGKGVRKDAGHNKLTYPALLGEGESRRRAEALINEACDAIASFGERSRRLEALARFVLERDH